MKKERKGVIDRSSWNRLYRCNSQTVFGLNLKRDLQFRVPVSGANRYSDFGNCARFLNVIPHASPNELGRRNIIKLILSVSKRHTSRHATSGSAESNTNARRRTILAPGQSCIAKDCCILCARFKHFSIDDGNRYTMHSKVLFARTLNFAVIMNSGLLRRERSDTFRLT